MRAYSEDLRQRIVFAVHAGGSRRAVAQQFQISLRTVDRYLRQERETGQLTPGWPSGRPRVLAREHEPRLQQQLAEQQTATLAEHCQQWVQTTGTVVSHATMSRHRPTGLDPKQRTVAARERDPQARAAWWDDVRHGPVERLVFLDETSTNTAMLTKYARAPRGQRADARAPRNHGPNVTLIAALALSGPGPALVVEGAVTREVFLAYVEQVLLPWLVPGQQVILDNRNVHSPARIRTLIEVVGCTVRFPPAYSPDFSPIEAAFAKLKVWLRHSATRTYGTLVSAIGTGLARITSQDAVGSFRGCGYHVDRQRL